LDQLPRVRGARDMPGAHFADRGASLPSWIILYNARFCRGLRQAPCVSLGLSLWDY